MSAKQRKIYIRKPCRIYHLWPENWTFTVPGLTLSYSNDTRREVSLAVRTWSNRPSFSEPAAPLSIDGTVGSHIRLGNDVGFWVGYSIVADKDKHPIGSVNVIPRHQGEIDIGILADDFERSEDIFPISKDLIDLAICFLTVALQDRIFSIADIQTEENNGEPNLSSAPPISVDNQARLELSREEILEALNRYRDFIGGLSLEDLRTLAVVSRRLNSALVEEDMIDRFCDYWECCEFLAPRGKTINGVKLSGSKDQAIAKLFSVYAGRQVSINQIVKDLYSIRGDIVHKAIESPERVSKGIFILRDLSLHLFRFRVGLGFELTPEFVELVQARSRGQQSE